MGLDVLLRDLERLRACSVRLRADGLRCRVKLDEMFSRFDRAEHASIHTSVLFEDLHDPPLQGAIGAADVTQVYGFAAIDERFIRMGRLRELRLRSAWDFGCQLPVDGQRNR